MHFSICTTSNIASGTKAPSRPLATQDSVTDGGTKIPSREILSSACDEIYRRWCRFVPEDQAREQAEQFRRRCEALAGEGHLTEPELDATLAAVAKIVAMS